MLRRYSLVEAIRKVTSEPAKSFSVRALAKEAKISPGSASSALSYMKHKGMVTPNVIGRAYQYRANLESALCRQWKILFNLDFLEDTKVAGELAKKIAGVQSILLYGSFAKGTNDGKSDLDLLVIANNPGKTDLSFLNKTGKEANLTLMSIKDWKNKAKQEKVFYENVIYDSIVLYGERPVVL